MFSVQNAFARSVSSTVFTHCSQIECLQLSAGEIAAFCDRISDDEEYVASSASHKTTTKNLPREKLLILTIERSDKLVHGSSKWCSCLCIRKWRISHRKSHSCIQNQCILSKPKKFEIKFWIAEDHQPFHFANFCWSRKSLTKPGSGLWERIFSWISSLATPTVIPILWQTTIGLSGV